MYRLTNSREPIHPFKHWRKRRKNFVIDLTKDLAQRHAQQLGLKSGQRTCGIIHGEFIADSSGSNLQITINSSVLIPTLLVPQKYPFQRFAGKRQPVGTNLLGKWINQRLCIDRPVRG